MAKDGTMRGGARVGSGRKSKALTEKIGSGLAASVIELQSILSARGALNEGFLWRRKRSTTSCR